MPEFGTTLPMLEEAKFQQAREDIRILGEEKFGPPTPAALDLLRLVDTHHESSRLLKRILKVSSWEELFQLEFNGKPCSPGTLRAIYMMRNMSKDPEHRGDVTFPKMFLRIMGTREFGPPDQTVLNQLEAISDFQQLDEVYERILVSSSWQEVFP
jgi:hypothetical protein